MMKVLLLNAGSTSLRGTLTEPVTGAALDFFDFQSFSHGDFAGAMAETLGAESLTRVLYPDDSTSMGRGLRFVQEYFLAACSLADLVRRWPCGSALRWVTLAAVNSIATALGQPERDARTLNMVAAMASEDFGSCTNHAECEAACPKGAPLEFIAGLNRDLIRAAFRRRREPLAVVGVPQHPAHEDT
jgi:hypothetical protein